MNWSEVLDTLVGEGLLSEELAPELETLGSDRGSVPPWFVRLLLGFGAWVASLFAVICFFLIGFMDSEAAFLLMGTLLAGGAVLLRRAISETGSDFFNQLALAGCVTGQILFSVGLAGALDGVEIWVPAAVVAQAVLIAFYPDRTGRFLTALDVVVHLLFLADDVPLLPVLIPAGLWAAAAWLWLRANRLLAGRLGPAQTPLAYASVTGLFLTLLVHVGHTDDVLIMASVALTLGVAALAGYLARSLGAPPAWPTLGVLVLGVCTYQAPGVVASVGAMLLGFHGRSRLLQGLAWLFLLIFGSYFYYELEIDLLTKSGLLALSGGMLLFLRWLLLRSGSR